MALALFDLDNTLILGDSAQAFSEYMAASDIVTPDNFLQANQIYMHDYDAGRLVLNDYMKYTLSPLTVLTPAQANTLINQFVEDILPKMLLPKALQLIDEHRHAGDEIVIISATGSHLVFPIARRLGVEHALAVDIETIDGYITGEITGIPTFREGKVLRAQAWAKTRNFEVSEAVFYSDSHNDLPLLEAVQRPVAVDPDPQLQQEAKQRGWEIISLR